MPNWITNKIQAPPHVIRAMLNGDGKVDFNTAAPFPGPNDNWSSISMAAETAAEAICNVPLSDSPILAALLMESRSRLDIKKLSDYCFEQFIGMVQNYRACGYLHSMQFAREVWGTKWNACRPIAEPDEGWCEFETVWACPEGVLTKVSERFPEDAITVIYADEDIGANCGTFVLKGGEVISEDIAPRYDKMTPEDRRKWAVFACNIKGYDVSEYFAEEEEAEEAEEVEQALLTEAVPTQDAKCVKTSQPPALKTSNHN